MKILKNGVLYSTYEVPEFSQDELLEVALDIGVNDISKANLLFEALINDQNEEDEEEENNNQEDEFDLTSELPEEEIEEEPVEDNPVNTEDNQEAPEQPETPLEEPTEEELGNDTNEEPSPTVEPEKAVSEEPKVPVVNVSPVLKSKSLRTLYNNFFKLWPKRKGTKNNFRIDAKENHCLYIEAKTINCKIEATVYSEHPEKPKQVTVRGKRKYINKESYKCSIQTHRNTLVEPWSIDGKCEVKCDCAAFKYYTAYPNLKNKSLYARPSKENKIPNNPTGKNNPLQVPALCKHLAAMTEKLMNEGLLLS